jgi:glutathione synthase/RimK-type ligase-like ATP-grasp enzyme
MTPEPYVLIISTKACVATDEVVRCLARQGTAHYRLNTEEYPFKKTIAYRPGEFGEPGWLCCDGISVATPTSIWYRRFRTPPPPDGIDEDTATFCRQEARAALIGSIARRAARWMSHPTALWQAEFKPYQLELAASIGLSIPRTIITSDPTEVQKAFAEFKGMIVKPARSGYFVRNGVEHAIYTSQVLEEHLGEIESARLSPAIYQEMIPKRFDIRVTVVGSEIFAAAIDSQTDPAAVTDWRQTDDADLPHYRHELPNTLSDLLLQFMQMLGLSFGAIDLVQKPDGDYVFLEVNPSGQWLWLDDKLNLGISDCVAAWLSAG